MVANSLRSKGYHLLDPVTYKIVVHKDVVFTETEGYQSQCQMMRQFLLTYQRQHTAQPVHRNERTRKQVVRHGIVLMTM